MPPVVPSTMAAELAAAGLDPAKLPPLSEMDKETLKKIMPTFAHALGMGCTDCHIPHQFAAPTEMKAVAAGMWDHFVTKLSRADGSLLYCDSCHQGKRKPLVRTDLAALKFAMDQQYGDGLKRRDGVANDCGTCHGEPFHPQIERDLWKARTTSSE